MPETHIVIFDRDWWQMLFPASADHDWRALTAALAEVLPEGIVAISAETTTRETGHWVLDERGRMTPGFAGRTEDRYAFHAVIVAATAVLGSFVAADEALRRTRLPADRG